MSTELKGRSPAGSWHNVQVTPEGALLVDGSVSIQPTSNVSSIVKVAWDDFQVITKNASGCPTLIRYFNGVTQVAQIAITYDVDGDLQRLQVT